MSSRIAPGFVVGLVVAVVAAAFLAVRPAAAQAPVDGGQELRSGVAELMDSVAGRLARPRTPVFEEAGLPERYRAAAMTAFMLIAPVILVAAVGAVAGARPGRLVRTVLGRLPLAVVVTVAAVALVRLWFELVDDLTAVWTGGGGGGVAATLGGVAEVLRQPPGKAPSFLGNVAAVLAGSAALAIWLELVLRDAVVFVCLAFLPLTAVSTLLPATTAWMRKLVAALALAAATPLLITVVLDAGLAAMPAAGVDGYEAVMFSAGVMAVAAAAPFLAFRCLRAPDRHVREPDPPRDAAAPPLTRTPELDSGRGPRLALAPGSSEEAAP